MRVIFKIMLFLDESIMHVISLVLSLYCSGGRKVVQPQKSLSLVTQKLHRNNLWFLLVIIQS